jgi:hypothetical protein
MQFMSIKVGQLFETFGDRGRSGKWHVTMADGMGTYFDALPQKRFLGRVWNRQVWESTLAGWLKQGHSIDVLLVKPEREHNDANINQGIANWQKIQALFPQSLNIFVMDAAKASDPKNLASINAMETFHATLFEGPDNKRAMWIESIHHPDSRYAYNVEFVHPDDVVGEKAERFDAYRGLYDNLIGRNPGNVNPAHLRVITPVLRAA